jgi:opacity protein-like surface antigen
MQRTGFLGAIGAAILTTFLAFTISAAAYAEGIASKGSKVGEKSSDNPWTGPWIAGSVGYAVQTTHTSGDGADTTVNPPGPNNVTTITGVPFSFDTAADGVTGAVSAGYDLQAGRFVFGVFADYAWMNAKQPFTVQTGAGGAVIGDIGIDSAWALGGRLGYLLTQRVLAYGLAGYTQANLTGAYEGSSAGGLTVGGGLEAMADSGWALKIEYRFTDLGGDTFTIPGVAPVVPPGWTASATDVGGASDHNLHEVRVGVAYRF